MRCGGGGVIYFVLCINNIIALCGDTRGVDCSVVGNCCSCGGCGCRDDDIEECDTGVPGDCSCCSGCGGGCCRCVDDDGRVGLCSSLCCPSLLLWLFSAAFSIDSSNISNRRSTGKDLYTLNCSELPSFPPSTNNRRFLSASEPAAALPPLWL